MLIALDSNMQRIKIALKDQGQPPFFCQVCGEEVIPTKTDTMGVPCWKHKEKPCIQWENETSEHLIMKNALLLRLPKRLKPQLEFVVGATLTDIMLPDLKVNIECQANPQTLLNVKKRLWKLSRLGYYTIWVWYRGKNYAKIIELGKQQTYHKLNARLIESLVLSQFFTEEEQRASSKAFWEDYDEALNSERPRYYMFYEQGKFYWFNIIRRYGKKFYSGAIREFDFQSIGVELYKTDIGRLAAFVQEERPDTQQILGVTE